MIGVLIAFLSPTPRRTSVLEHVALEKTSRTGHPKFQSKPGTPAPCALSLLSFKPNRALAVPPAMPPATRTAPVSGEGVFSLRFMASLAYVASPIPRLVSLEVVEALRPALRHRSSVTVMRIKAVVYVAIKTVMAVKPWASSKKHPASKPIGAIVAVGSTVIWRIVEVSVRTHGSGPDVYANFNLGWRHGCTA